MLRHKLLRCRSCQLKWFARGGTPAACPACGGNEVGGAFELFHLGIIVIVLAGLVWMLPSMREASGDDHPASTAVASLADSQLSPQKPAQARPSAVDVQRTHPTDAQRARPADVQRAHPAAGPVSATIKAKKLAVRVQRGPAKGHTLTLRRGDKVTILDRKDRRFLVRDRRGNQVYVPLDKVNVQKTAETRRQYVQR